MKRFLLMLAAFFLLGAAAAAADHVIHFREQAQVSGKVVTLGEVAKISSGSASQDATLSKLKLGDAPDQGSSLQWSAADVSQRLYVYANFLRGIQIKIPEMLTIVRANVGVSTAELKHKIEETLKSKLTEDHWDIEVSEVVAPKNLSLPEGAALEIVSPSQRPSGLTSFEVIIVDAKGVRTRQWMNAVVRYYTRVGVLTRIIEPRTHITAADVTWQRKEITSFQDVPANQSDLITSVAKLRLSPGQIVTRAQLERELALHYGDEVVITAGDEIFAVTTKGIAQQNGFLGDTVKVKSQDNNKLIEATVTSRGVVHVRY